MNVFKSIRPSNLVLLAAAPFIIYLFASSSKYTRALTAIIGVEPGSGALFTGFLLLLVPAALACIPWYQARYGDPLRGRELVVPVSYVVQLAVLAYLATNPAAVMPFVSSVIANSVDPFTSTWVVPTVRPRQLTPEFSEALVGWLRAGLVVYGLAMAGLVALANFSAARIAYRARQAVAVLGFVIVFYLAFFAYWGFASGVAITFRAAIFAYVLASLLGLFWTGLAILKQKRRTIVAYAVVSVALLAVAAFYYAQPRETYVVVGTTEARIAIIKGTPQSLADTIRFGEYDGANGESTRIRSVVDVADSLAQIRDNPQVSGGFIPVEFSDGSLPVLWEVSFLPPRSQVPALVFSVLGLLLAVFTFGGHQHRMHPLAVASEFFVDTIRGIPMLVIILYIGLPLSGAIKEASSGVIDLPNMARGVVAIAVGYSAYMAEIFRAGIEAIPRGQIEAAASLGMKNWQIARLIVLPQALKIVIPPLGNEFIAMIKDTSLLSILSVRDVTQRMREFQASSFLPFSPFNTAAIVYVVITLACASFLKWLERRYDAR
ncbi:MAG: amino acid ABC transporter permease [Alphaproteobacteria bacterium]